MKRCVALVTRNTRHACELIIIDNGSTDSSVDFIESLGCRRVLNRTNRGFPVGVNQGIALAGRNDVCLLNSDAEPREGWLTELYATRRRCGAGIVGPVGHGDPAGYQSIGSISKDTPAKNLVGYCMLIGREVIDAIGHFDERFTPGGWEDEDFALRAAIAGFRAFLSYRSHVLHRPHQTFERNGVDWWRLHCRNEIAFRTKWWDVLTQLGLEHPAIVRPVAFQKSDHAHPTTEGGAMQQPHTINPDLVCQQAVQAKLNVYQAREQFESVLKTYNDQLDNLVNLVNLMKNRIVQLEGDLARERERAEAKDRTAADKLSVAQADQGG